MTGPVIASRFSGRNWMLRRRIMLFLLPRSARHRGLSETQIKTNEAQLELLNPIAAISIRAGPRIWAVAWPLTEKAPLESVLNCCNCSLSHTQSRCGHTVTTCGSQDLAHKRARSCRQLQWNCILPKWAHAASDIVCGKIWCFAEICGKIEEFSCFATC